MEHVDQAVLALETTVSLAPVAVYFLILGLVNSHPHPQIIRSRNDWITLTIVFVPLLVWPALWFAQSGRISMTVAFLSWAAAMWLMFLPKARSGWAIYNIDTKSARRLLRDAVDQCGANAVDDGQHILLPDANITLRIRSFSLLRNVTIVVDSGTAIPEHTRLQQEALLDKLEDILIRRIQVQWASPSIQAACLLVIGTIMLTLPLFMMARHADAIVQLVGSLWA